MDTVLFATCGRGLGVFAREEIQKKLINVTSVHELGEGKISFTIRYHPEDSTSDAQPVADMHLDDTPEINTVLRKYKIKLESIVRSSKWSEISRRVQLLRDHQTHNSGPWVRCQQPSTCPAYTDKRIHQTHHRGSLTPAVDGSADQAGPGQINNNNNNSNSHIRPQLHHHNPPTPRYRKKRKLDICPDRGENESRKNHCTSGIDGEENSNYYKSGKCVFIQTGSEASQSAGSREKSVSPSETATVSPTETATVSTTETTTVSPTETTTSESATEILPNEAQVLDPQCLSLSNYVQAKENRVCRDSEVSDNEEITFRVSSRISGVNKSFLTKEWVNQNMIQEICELMSSWTVNYRKPLLDVYVNITDSHFIIGVSLTERPLSLRRYAAHLPLRSTIGYLVAHLAAINPGATVLDPMCGSGTILLEAATNFKVGQVIASDNNTNQLQVARCNLRFLKTPVVFLLADATAVPMQCSSVDVVVCDFPFGQKHKVAGNAPEMLRKVLLEVARLLVYGGRAVFLLSPYQHHRITHSNGHEDSFHTDGLPLQFEASHLVSLGETSAYVTIFTKGERSA